MASVGRTKCREHSEVITLTGVIASEYMPTRPTANVVRVGVFVAPLPDR